MSIDFKNMEVVKNHFVIDGMNMAYRAHSIFIDARTEMGEPSGMFYGFLKMLLSLRNKYRGYKFVVAWDNKAKWKYDLFPGYKAERSQLSSRVFDQINYIKSFLECCNVDQYEKNGEEADDIIASIVESYKCCKGNILIYTNDKDMLQLVEMGKVAVMRPKVGTTPEKIYDHDAVRLEFGVPPEKLPEFRALDGDSSDTIPGVPRVPRTILAMLVNASNSPVDIFGDNLKNTNLTEFRRTSIESFKEQFVTNYKIMKLRRNICGIEYRPGRIDAGIMGDLLKRFEVKSLDPETFKGLFEEELVLKYTDPMDTIKVESYSLFE